MARGDRKRTQPSGAGSGGGSAGVGGGSGGGGRAGAAIPGIVQAAPGCAGRSGGQAGLSERLRALHTCLSRAPGAPPHPWRNAWSRPAARERGTIAGCGPVEVAFGGGVARPLRRFCGLAGEWRVACGTPEMRLARKAPPSSRGVPPGGGCHGGRRRLLAAARPLCGILPAQLGRREPFTKGRRVAQELHGLAGRAWHKQRWSGAARTQPSVGRRARHANWGPSRHWQIAEHVRSK